MGAVRKITGAKAAKWAGRDQAKSIEQGIAEQKLAYDEVAPGIAQFMMPQHAQAFGFGQQAADTQALPVGVAAGGFGGQPMDALSQIRAASGVLGNDAQAQFYEDFQEDPGTAWQREQGLRAVNRQMQARGGLGGGSRLKAITEFSQNLANQTMGNRLNQLSGLAQTDLSLASQMAGLRTGLGSNVAQGLTQAGAARSQGEIAGAGLTNQFYGNVLDMAGQWLGGSKLPPSDQRLKTNIQYVDTIAGANWYEWDWNEAAQELGLSDEPQFGVIAQEIRQTHPECVIVHQDGYLRVNYERLLGKLKLIEEAA